MIKDWLRSENNASRKKRLLVITLTGFLFCILASRTNAQTATLRNPLIPGYQQTSPFVAPHECPPPPVGDGTIPDGINPGMPDPAPVLPWVPAIPANQIDIDNSKVNLGVDNSVETPPGVLGKSLTVPPPPSTPGPDPGMLPGPLGFKKPPARIVNIKPQGGMPGDLPPPTKKWGGQTTGDFGLYRPNRFGNDDKVGSQLTDFGQPLKEVAVKPPKASEDGPRPANYPGERNRHPNEVQGKNGKPTTDLYGNRTQGRLRSINTPIGIFMIPSRPRPLMTIAPY